MANTLDGFEPVKSERRGKWQIMLDEFNAMSADCIGKFFPSREKAAASRMAIAAAVRRRGYSMTVIHQGKMVYVVKDDAL